MPFVGPTLLAAPESDLVTRAEFARHHLWVTRYDPTEMHAAGDYPIHHPGDGLGTWVKQERDLVNEDVVVWHTFGTSHLPRPKDWTIMSCDYVGFRLKPAGFFNRNPALDVPPPSTRQTGHCHEHATTPPRQARCVLTTDHCSVGRRRGAGGPPSGGETEG